MDTGPAVQKPFTYWANTNLPRRLAAEVRGPVGLGGGNHGEAGGEGQNEHGQGGTYLHLWGSLQQVTSVRSDRRLTCSAEELGKHSSAVGVPEYVSLY